MCVWERDRAPMRVRMYERIRIGHLNMYSCQELCFPHSNMYREWYSTNIPSDIQRMSIRL